MSLSKPRATTSPVERNFELKLAVGSVGYYDRDAKKNVTVTGPAGEWEKGATYPAAPPFRAIVLDVFSFIGGFNNKQQSGIWSNEVRSTRDEEFVVRTRGGVLKQGLYADIRDEVTNPKVGGKFGNSVYIAFREDGEWKLGNLKLIGAGLSAFFDFKKGKFFDSDPGLAITAWQGKQTGTNEYFSPVFESWDVGAADLAAASSLDETLQQFLGAVPAKAEESVDVESDEFNPEPPF